MTDEKTPINYDDALTVVSDKKLDTDAMHLVSLLNNTSTVYDVCVACASSLGASNELIADSGKHNSGDINRSLSLLRFIETKIVGFWRMYQDPEYKKVDKSKDMPIDQNDMLYGMASLILTDGKVPVGISEYVKNIGKLDAEARKATYTPSMYSRTQCVKMELLAEMIKRVRIVLRQVVVLAMSLDSDCRYI